jgi:hypothetical protein
MSGYSFLTQQLKFKRLGSYLLEAELLTQAQVDVALADQQVTGMQFGEILVARGWIKQQTIEYLMQKVILPERRVTVERACQEQLTEKPSLQQPL